MRKQKKISRAKKVKEPTYLLEKEDFVIVRLDNLENRGFTEYKISREEYEKNPDLYKRLNSYTKSVKRSNKRFINKTTELTENKADAFEEENDGTQSSQNEQITRFLYRIFSQIKNPDMRKIAQKRYIKKMKIKDIAKKYGYTIAQVNHYLKRTRKYIEAKGKLSLEMRKAKEKKAAKKNY